MCSLGSQFIFHILQRRKLRSWNTGNFLKVARWGSDRLQGWNSDLLRFKICALASVLHWPPRMNLDALKNLPRTVKNLPQNYGKMCTCMCVCVYASTRASQVAQWVKNRPAMQETQEMWVRSLGWEDPLAKGMAAHWRSPKTEEPGGLQSRGSQRVRHDRSGWAQTHTCKHLFVYLYV